MEAIIFIGIQATGKTTFYKNNFFKTHIRISLDMLKTRNREDILLAACVKAKQPFVVDNTNPTIMDRKKYIDIAKAAGFKVKGYYFKSSIEDAVLRNEGREGKEHIPLIGIRNAHAKLQLPQSSEGFDEIYYVQINMENKFVIEEWNYEI
ncbi:MAG: AAA family ATPase [Bacillota bacterium]|nr:AAA family ATPase [Bacillota bacterium]